MKYCVLPVYQTSILLKKSTVILFLIIVFLSQCGYYCFCTIQLLLAKEAAREQLLKDIPENLLTKICTSDNTAIQWEEEGKEFRLNGEMYDVVKMKYENGKTYVICINDEKEDEIFAAFEKVIESNIENSSNQSKHHSTGKIVIPDWVLELQQDNPGNVNPSIIKREYLPYTSNLYYHFIEVNSPPPDFNYKLNTTT